MAARRTTTATTTALLEALRAAEDSPMWAPFVERYGPILEAIGRRLGLDREDAADVAQQALIEFVRDMRAGRYDRDRGRLRSWLVSIAEYRARDLRRRAAVRGRGRVPLEGATESLRADLRAELEAVWADEERKVIAAAAWREVQANARIDRRTLQAFELVALRGVPPEEAARTCGMTVDSVYVAKHRVAMRLRRAVESMEAAYRDELGGGAA
jgi:RNA polymerase sigma-70 factor (ECF subfamily)